MISGEARMVLNNKPMYFSGCNRAGRGSAGCMFRIGPLETVESLSQERCLVPLQDLESRSTANRLCPPISKRLAYHKCIIQQAFTRGNFPWTSLPGFPHPGHGHFANYRYVRTNAPRSIVPLSKMSTSTSRTTFTIDDLKVVYMPKLLSGLFYIWRLYQKASSPILLSG